VVVPAELLLGRRPRCGRSVEPHRSDVSKPAGEIPVRVEGGSVDVRWRRPTGAAARIHAAGGSIRVTADGVRQRGFGSLGWQSTGFDSSSDRYDARFSGGSVSVEVEQG
jgi:hypothetical protein